MEIHLRNPMHFFCWYRTTSFIIGIMTIIPLVSGQGTLHFDQIGVDKGLPDMMVRTIIQDNQDYMWFGTTGGICRYDGEKVKVYSTDDKGMTFQDPARVIAMVLDPEGQLWAASSRNVYRYSAEKDVFEKVGARSIAELQEVASIHIDSRENIWVGSMRNGLFRYNKGLDEFVSAEFREEVKSESGHLIHSDDDNLWFSTLNGLYKFRWSESTLIHHEISKDEGTTFYEQPALDLFTSRNKDLWLGTRHQGLMRYNRNLGQFESFTLNHPNLKDEFSVLTIEEGSEGKLWINVQMPSDHLATGLYVVDVQTHLCQHFPSSEEPGSIGPVILSIFRDKHEDMWFGTMYDGVYHHSPQHKAFINWRPKGVIFDFPYILLEHQHQQIWFSTGTELIPISSLNNLPVDVYKMFFGAVRDQHNQIWAPSWLGLRRFNPSGTTQHYLPDPNKPGSIPTTPIPSALVDHDQILWLSAWNYGLYRYFETTDSFAPHLMIDPVSGKIIGNAIEEIFEDSQYNIWVGSESGLIKLGRDRMVDTVLTMASCWTIHEDESGFLWLATEAGLVRLDPTTYEQTSWHKEDGLPTDRIFSLLADDHGNLWLGTQNGLSRFNPSTQTFRNFDVSDGLAGNQFVIGMCMRSSDGRFYFKSGATDILEFHPDSIHENPNKPKVVITDIRLRNHNLSDIAQENLLARARTKHTLELGWEQNDFAIDFAALNYFRPEKNNYKYRLENYDQNWTYTNATGSNANYTNLDPGQYIFHVYGSNNDGVWSEVGAQLLINIKPPWWQTNLAYSLFALLGLLMLWGLRHYEMSRQRLRHQLELEHVKAKSLEVTNTMKSRFFANITHEFRTPLTLILGPVSELISKFPKSDLRALESVQRNAQRLMTLIKQLLDLSKLEANELKLEASEGDMVPFIRQIYALFTTTAQTRNIEYSFHCQMESLNAFCDWEKLEQIIFNLLGNSFKFTPDGGCVNLELSSLNKSDGSDLSIPQIEIVVSDSGPGIAPEEIPKIFDRFYQVDATTTRRQEGSGLGLSLVRELVELHSGSIDVKSNEGQGTQFTLCLPKGNDHLMPDQIVDKKPKVERNMTWTGSILTVQPSVAIEHNGNKELPLVLIAEDNTDMRHYLRNALQDHCRIVETPDGQQALDYALKEVPDLIISDIMMPVVDGLALCQTIKNDTRTSHIPVILLTAKVDVQDRIQGLQHGADAYLSKPFHKEELRVRISKLLELRAKLHARYLSLNSSSHTNDPRLKKEDLFIATLQKLMEENLSDTDFGTAQICRSMGLSRAQLYRKVKALTGKPLGQFISVIRLRRAKQLLNTSDLNISEVGYEVGFKDPAYFSRSFKELYGAPPSNFR